MFSELNFSQWKIEVMEHIIHYVKLEIWTASFYENYLAYFQSYFPNSSIDPKLVFSEFKT